MDFDFFKLKYNNIKPEQGKILISAPYSSDSLFRYSVVLLAEHSDTGSLGFILNKPLNIDLNEVVSDLFEFESLLSIGGPVGKDTLHYIHTLGDKIPNSIPIFDNLFWGGDFSMIKDFINAGMIKPFEIRFFIGYSGWDKEQLLDEVNKNFWLVTTLSVKEIMTNNKQDIWKSALEQVGKKYSAWKNFPENPIMN